MVSFLINEAVLSDDKLTHIRQLATRLVEDVREARKKTTGIDSFLTEYALSSEEGIALMCLAEARFGIIFGAVGAARDCFESALEYASTREQFDGPIARHQITQYKLATMATNLNNAMLLALHLGKIKDAHQIKPEQISMGKFNNVNGAIEIAREARTILGAAGITTEYPIFRHMNNLESVLTYEGTHEIHSLVIGQALTGIAAFR